MVQSYSFSPEDCVFPVVIGKRCPTLTTIVDDQYQQQMNETLRVKVVHTFVKKKVAIIIFLLCGRTYAGASTATIDKRRPKKLEK